MTTIDLSPLYRNTIGFDRLAAMLNGAFRAENSHSSYPPYDIESLDDDRYAITLAVAGFTQDEIDIEVERGVLSIRGRKADDNDSRHFLYQGIATRAFERKFNLADHVEIINARLADGLLTIELKHEIPEAMKARRIDINSDARALTHTTKTEQAA